jgi:phosphotransferase system enzyme I (PtsP)
MNAGLPLELEQLAATGAEGIGLFRTEILMLARGAFLSVDDQAAAYGRVLDAAGERPVVFRTLDLGSDKLLPGAPTPVEENPAMGWRSLRVGLDRPMLLRRQLRALLRAGRGRALTVMFPMVSTVDEFCAARRLLLVEAWLADVQPTALAVGSMLEVPALLWQLPALLKEVDFISLGTNDLLQFVFAADRGAAGLAGRYDPLSPPVLAMLEQVVAACRAAGKPVSVCGEMAARPLEALVLVALGLVTLSVPAGSILPLKAMFASVDLGSFRSLLATLRRTTIEAGALRLALESWAAERGLIP